MTLLQQGLKELKRIMRSLKYRTKVYGVDFPTEKDSILKSILKRDVKRFTKQDIDTLKDVKGDRLYSLGEYKDYTGRTIKGREIAKEVIKPIKKAQRQINKEIRERAEQYEYEPYKPKNYAKPKQEKSFYTDRIELRNSTDEIIASWFNKETWLHGKDNLMQKVNDFGNRAIGEFGRRGFAHILETAMNTGDLIKLKTESYFYNFNLKIEQHLQRHFRNQITQLSEIDEEATNDDIFSQYDYDE